MRSKAKEIMGKCCLGITCAVIAFSAGMITQKQTIKNDITDVEVIETSCEESNNNAEEVYDPEDNTTDTKKKHIPSAGISKAVIDSLVVVEMEKDVVKSSYQSGESESVTDEDVAEVEEVSMDTLGEKLDVVINDASKLEPQITEASAEMDSDTIEDHLEGLSILKDKVDNIKQSIDVMENDLDARYDVLNGPNMICHFNPNDVRELTGADAETLDIILEDTYLEGLGQFFYTMENTYGVNALFSIGNTALESGWGTSRKYRDYNNLYGIDINNYTYYWSSREACIEYWFKLLSSKYIDQGFTSISKINTKYCPDGTTSWGDKITAISYKLQNKI